MLQELILVTTISSGISVELVFRLVIYALACDLCFNWNPMWNLSHKPKHKMQLRSNRTNKLGFPSSSNWKVSSQELHRNWLPWLPLTAIGCHCFPLVSHEWVFWCEYRNAHSEDTYGSEKKGTATTGKQWQPLATNGNQRKAMATKETNFDEVPAF